MSAPAVGSAIPLTSFVGRRQELGFLRALVASSRLVTVTGPGGSGKTRLVDEFVADGRMPGRSGSGVAYLASTSDGEALPGLVASAVGLRDQSGDPLAELVAYLRERPYLLVLDNCEHLVEPTSQLVSELLRQCRGLRIVATSRRPLLVPGEQLLPIGGLTDDAAMDLFLERARRVAPSFAASPPQVEIVRDICRRLDGMPLAIELAAARVRAVALDDLAKRVTDRVSDLGSASTALPPRHRSLRATIAWSHDLMTTSEQVTWRRICRLPDSFTAQGASAIATGPPLRDGEVEEILERLVDQSLIVFDQAAGRYSVIEATRAVGLERLIEAGESEMVEARLTQWALERAEMADARWWGADQVAILSEMRAEWPTIRAALESSERTGDTPTGLRIATALLWSWIVQGTLGEARRWYAVFLGTTDDARLEGRAAWRAAFVELLRGSYEDAGRHLDRAERLVAMTGDRASRAWIAALRQELVHESDSAGADAVGAAGLAALEAVIADPDAEPLCRSYALNIASVATGGMGRGWDEARRLAIEGAARSEAVGELWIREAHLRAQALAELQLGRPDVAETLTLDALRLDRRIDDVWHEAWAMESLAFLAALDGRAERGARLLGVAIALWEVSRTGLPERWSSFRAMTISQIQGMIGRARLDEELARGRSMDRGAAIAWALGESAPPPAAAIGSPGDPSVRQLEVAGLIADGMSNRDIAERLYLSPRTVEKHVELLMNKLGIGSRAEIAAWYARRAR